ncbi:ComEC/Rec2 family competence protein [Chryseobacterium sp. NRRL B-14859]|uniref:ComEC/Rec2 family competence protein n=1 Tax=Chryseobacterium sp. NRRL B-14859 TaxID=1562763 RepID=UPI0033935350
MLEDRFALDQKAVYFLLTIGLGIIICLFFHSYFLHKIRPVLLSILFFLTGIVIHFYNASSPDIEAIATGKQTIIFKISQKLNSSEKYRKYDGMAEIGNTPFHSLMYVSKGSRELDFKHLYKAKAYIVKTKSPTYDFQFDYAQYLKRKDIGYQCYLSQEISAVENNDLSSMDKVRQFRLDVLKKIDRTEMTGKTKEFLKGIILADRTEIDPDTIQDFNRSGLIHFLAISGTHIVVIFGMFYFILRRFIPLSYRRYTIIVSLVFIWLFAGLIGFGNSVLRSCIMLSVYFVYVILQRKPDLLHSLGLSALIILILDTQQLFDVGFQLSFVAVLGIFWMNQPLLKYFPVQDNYFKKLIFNTITISLSAQLSTLPLVLYYFHQFSLVSIVANCIIVPFSEVIIVFSFLMTVFITFLINPEFLNVIYDTTIQILLKLIHWFAEVDFLFFENIPMNMMEVLSILVIVYFLRPFIIKTNFKNSARLLMTVLAFLLIRTGSDIFENRREEILFYTFNKTRVFSVKMGNKACFWISDVKDRQRVQKFIINPYCYSRRLNDFEIKTFPPTVHKVVFRDKAYDIK